MIYEICSIGVRSAVQIIVLVPVNRSRFHPQLLGSLGMQSDQDFSVVVGDEASAK